MTLKNNRLKRKRPMVTATINPKIHKEFNSIVTLVKLNKSAIVETAIILWLEQTGRKLLTTNKEL